MTPGSVKKIQERGTNFQLMENVQRFQAFAKKYGLPEEEIFQTADLFEKRNIAQVTLSLFSLARLVSYSTYFVRSLSICSIFSVLIVLLCFRVSLSRLKNILNGMAHLLDQKWPIRMNEHSLMSNCELMKASWTCKWATIKVLHRPDTAAWVIHDTCKSHTNISICTTTKFCTIISIAVGDLPSNIFLFYNFDSSISMLILKSNKILRKIIYDTL